MSKNDLIPVLNNTQIAEQERKAATEKQELAKSSEAVLLGLAGEIRRRWEQAKRFKNRVEQQLLKNKRARNGEYEPAKLAAIKQMFGEDYSPVYMMITETKCRAAEAWIKQFIIQPNSKPWDLVPTPMPELPPAVEKSISDSIFENVINLAVNESIMAGQPIDQQMIQEKINLALPQIKEKINKEIKKHAKKAAEKMKEKISDQFAEGKWDKALDQLIYDIVTYKACFMKGPQQRKEIVRKRVLNDNGKWEPVTEERIISKYERRSPFNIYPSPDSTDINNGYLFDLISLTPKNLSDLIGVPGYKDEAIRSALQKYRNGGLREWTAIATEKARLENRDSMAIYESELIDCLEYWGTAQGQTLIDWGLDKEDIPDPDKEYNICSWMIGNEIIKATLNPDPFGNKPFDKASFVEDPDAFWGRGVPELIWDIQQICNAAARSIVNNVGIASGPQVEVDIDRADAGPIFPWKIWKSTNAQMRASKAVNFYMPQMVTTQLIEVYKWGLDQADEHSGVPRYSYGSPQSSQVGKTASGLSMMMTSSARGIKAVLLNLDKVIEGTVTRQYNFNMEYEDDVGIIGDLKVVARGSSSMMAKEQQAIRRKEFLDSTMNPYDMQILKLKGRKELLKEAAKSLEVDVDKVFDEEDELESQAGELEQNGMPPGKGQPLNVAGEPKSGKDFSLFAQKEA